MSYRRLYGFHWIARYDWLIDSPQSVSARHEQRRDQRHERERRQHAPQPQMPAPVRAGHRSLADLIHLIIRHGQSAAAPGTSRSLNINAAPRAAGSMRLTPMVTNAAAKHRPAMMKADSSR